MSRPRRIVIVTSGMQQGAGDDLSDVDWKRRRWDGLRAYSESKLFDATLAAAIARLWPQVIATSVSPGWVATKMGGADAPDDLEAASLTQAWLATSEDDAAKHTGTMYYHRKSIRSPGDTGARALHPAVTSRVFQDELLATLAEITGVRLPAGTL